MRAFGFLLSGVAFTVAFWAGAYAGPEMDGARWWLFMLSAAAINGALVNGYAALTEG